MHAQTTSADLNRHPNPLLAAGNVPAGQPFMRAHSNTEILARLSYAGSQAEDGDQVWCVVLNVRPHSPGFMPGQLVKLRGTEQVRRVYEARPALYTQEQ